MRTSILQLLPLRGVEAAKACVAAFVRHAALSQAAFLVALHAFHGWSDSLNGLSLEGLLSRATRTRARSVGHSRPRLLYMPQVPQPSVAFEGLAEIAKCEGRKVESWM